ncbi:hypothetical protein PIB30_053000 [Stylosanthes scabra]|uniref:Uncharacterized protein n=1 Tax=Stylosanthes scabra TaxID=79078 RepID=A0ABU6XG45_9FABA|nr:hypothetical protein [Stylosanthes scabra]
MEVEERVGDFEERVRDFEERGRRDWKRGKNSPPLLLSFITVVLSSHRDSEMQHRRHPAAVVGGTRKTEELCPTNLKQQKPYLIPNHALFYLGLLRGDRWARKLQNMSELVGQSAWRMIESRMRWSS